MKWNLSKNTVIGLVIVAMLIGFYYVSASPKGTMPAIENFVSKNEYKDGTYTAEGKYVSPGGDESIDVTLTLKNDIVTESQVESNATRPMSVKYQGFFIEGYKALVIGKNIDEVVLDKVSGSSLTPKGFNDAVEKIKAEAKV